MTDDELAAIEHEANEGPDAWLNDDVRDLLAEVRQLREQHEDDVSRLMLAGHENGQLRDGIKVAVAHLEAHAGVATGGSMVVSMAYAHLRMLLLNDTEATDE